MTKYLFIFFSAVCSLLFTLGNQKDKQLQEISNDQEFQ